MATLRHYRTNSNPDQFEISLENETTILCVSNLQKLRKVCLRLKKLHQLFDELQILTEDIMQKSVNTCSGTSRLLESTSLRCLLSTCMKNTTGLVTLRGTSLSSHPKSKQN